jgi:hypothetical protein
MIFTLFSASAFKFQRILPCNHFILFYFQISSKDPIACAGCHLVPFEINSQASKSERQGVALFFLPLKHVLCTFLYF